MTANGTYPENARAKVVRKKQRGHYDYATIHSILATAPILHVAFAPTAADPFPTILPMIGAVANYENHQQNVPNDPASQPQDIYLHGYVSARLLRLAKDAEILHDEGLPICISATSVDGLVLSLTPFSHSMNYRSAVLHGYARPVTDPAEKLWAMEHVTEAVLTGRWAGSRTPPTDAELTGTGILRVRVDSASAKVRTGPPGDEKKDRADAGVTGRVWTGVVPAWWQLGAPVSAEDNQVPLPDYVARYVREVNERNERGAVAAVSKTE